MKKVNVVQLIASVCLLLACIIRLLTDCGVAVLHAIDMCVLPLYFVSAVCYIVVLVQLLKNRKKRK